MGESRSLDDVEHQLLRQPGVYDDPYIHVAVVCASIGCPALRNEAFTANKIEQQLNDNMQRFLSDKRRNRYNAKTNTLEVSKIFNWYEKDFTKGYRDINSLNEFFSLYAKNLTDTIDSQQVGEDQHLRSLQVKPNTFNYVSSSFNYSNTTFNTSFPILNTYIPEG